MTNKENLLIIAPEITNEVQILTEFYHIQATMDMLSDKSIVRPNIVSKKDVIFNKCRNVEKYKDMSIKLGLIQE